MTAAIPYMEKDMGELARQTARKPNELTGEDFAELVFKPAEDMETAEKTSRKIGISNKGRYRNIVISSITLR